MIRVLLTLSLGLGVALDARAEERERPRLRFDPFVAPELGRAAGGGAPPPASRDADWSPVLSATLVAGDESLANLGGVLLGLGEESHGYRLIEVRPWEAVFEFGGERKTLPVVSREESP